MSACKDANVGLHRFTEPSTGSKPVEPISHSDPTGPDRTEANRAGPRRPVRLENTRDVKWLVSQVPVAASVAMRSTVTAFSSVL